MNEQYNEIGKGANYDSKPKVTPATIKSYLEGQDVTDRGMLVSILLNIEYNAEHWLTDERRVARYNILRKKVEETGFNA